MIIVSCNPVYTKVTATFWEAGGDTSVAWDTKGNAYFDCQVFDRGVPAATRQHLNAGDLFVAPRALDASGNEIDQRVQRSPDRGALGARFFE